MLADETAATPHKSPEEALRQSEQRFRNLVETTNDWIWEVDENLVYTYASPQVRSILGYEPDEVLGRKPWDFMPQEEAQRVKESVSGTISSRQPIESLENTNLHKSGSAVVLETSGVPFFDAGGIFRGYRGIDRDITRRNRAEQALRESEAFIRSITDLVPGRISYVDAAQRYRFINRRYEDWFQRPKHEILGRTVREVLGDSLYETVRPHVEAVLAGEETSYELELQAHGAKRHLSVVYVPHFGERRQVLGFYASIEDTTEHKQLEEQLRQSQKMEAVGTLAGGIAHDFNNLLTVMAGYSSMLVEDLGPGNPLAERVEEIQKAAKRATSLVQQLLAFSRKQIRRPTVLDLNAVVADLRSMLQRLISENIELRIEREPSPCRINADASQVQQVILNLVTNACGAMPQGGILMLQTRKVDLDEVYARQHVGLNPRGYALLVVSDTGHGMDAETQKHIFEPFFTTKEIGKGTGLGLSTVYGIVKQSGGHISVSSEPGRGTTFKVYLPAVDETLAPVESAVAETRPKSGMGTILLVEDEPALREMLRHSLCSRGYSVLEAYDGEQALRVSQNHQGAIDVLLTDVVMPRMGGQRLAERLASLRSEIKVLYMSGHAESGIVRDGVLDPRIAFLQKPFTAEALIRRLQQLLEGPSPPAE